MGIKDLSLQIFWKKCLMMLKFTSLMHHLDTLKIHRCEPRLKGFLLRIQVHLGGHHRQQFIYILCHPLPQWVPAAR
ncbi:hypothetical protein GDO86_001977 [Hymenochirus boettgeri]|uniref:Uncharacterized protein n=1 Tax=Hymenochirus boettgeri TaxID=247094 RepID=A0A8T2KJ91_9PIPI|nr:hypothetical protein GDO86_001977 [Hymenochirus boettgeri]